MPSESPTQSRIEQELLRPVPVRLSRALGVLCLIIALALALFLGWALNAAHTKAAYSVGLWGFLMLVVAVFAFFLSTGYRLVRNRHNKYGSLLSPALWGILAVALFAVAIAGAALCIATRNYSQFNGVLSALLLSVLSYGAASHFRRKEAKNAA